MIDKEKIEALIGTAIFTIILFLILLFSVFTLSSSPEELGGVPVMFGTSEDAFGMTEPSMTEIIPEVSDPALIPSEVEAAATQEEIPGEDLITQTTEPSIDVEAEKEKERRREQQAAEQRAREEAERKKRAEEARKREINRQMSGLFGEGTGSRGNTEGQGTQGVSTGNATQGAPKGNGGIGSYDLGGRSLGKGGLAQPRYTVNDYGTVVVNITVDPSGNVVHAEIGQGTNTPNTTLRNEALKAARNTKFNAINSANNQRGTITYRFNLN